MTTTTQPTQRHCRLFTYLAVLLLAACSSGSNTQADTVNQTDLAFFANSEHLHERFGTRTARNLSPQVNNVTRDAVVDSINDFSFNLHRAITAQPSDSGSIASGYSAAVALTLTSAATGGNTFSSLSTLLGFDALEESDVHAALNVIALELNSRTNDKLVLRSANRMFVRPGLELNTDFLDVATADFGAPVTEADFNGAPIEVANDVNGWVSEQTDGFIPSIIETFQPNTVFALLNAIFLDAAWQDQYANVGDRSFTALDGTSSDVASFGGRSNLPLLVSEQLTAVEIPYAGNELALLILMPESLTQFETTINADALQGIIDSLQLVDVEFSIPIWQDKSNIDLVKLLEPLGLPTSPWNFDRLLNQGKTLDVLALQKARIEVDENGTRAAAVTLVATVESLPMQLVINRPFFYALRDRTTGVVLFTGRVVAP